jgi:hypothetical protein
MQSIGKRVVYLAIVSFIIIGVAASMLICFLVPMTGTMTLINIIYPTSDVGALLVQTIAAFIVGFIFFAIGIVFIALHLNHLKLGEFREESRRSPEKQ